MNRTLCVIADGGSPIVQRWLQHHVAMGFNTTLISRVSPSPVPAQVDVVSLNSPKFVPATIAYAMGVPKVRRTVARLRPGIVHAHYGGGYGVLGALSGADRLVLSLWGSDLLVAPRRSRLRAALLRWMIRQTDAVCVNSRYLAASAAAYTSEFVHVTYFGVSPVFFRSRGGERASGEPLRVAMVKSFNENSGIDTLLTAMKKAADDGVPMILRAVGTDPGGSAKDLARRLGIADRVEFLGVLREEEIARVFSLSDVYVQPTKFTEGFGVAVVEAQAVGLPAVVSSVGGLVETIEGESGVMIPPDDPEALARALISYAADQDMLVRARSAAQVNAKRFAWDVVAPAMDSVYDRLLANGARRTHKRP